MANTQENKNNPRLLRFLQYLEFKDIALRNAEDALKVGNGRLGKMKANSTEIKDSFLMNILQSFPDLDRNWLITGEGSMVRNIPSTERRMVLEKTEGYIPVYDVTFTLGFTPTFLHSQNEPEILGYVNFPELRGSTYVVKAKGNSMSPLINDRDFVGIRPVKNKKIIDYGNPYGIITEDLAVFKKIKKVKEDDKKILLTSENPEHESYPIEKSEVIHLFTVIGILSVKSITY